MVVTLLFIQRHGPPIDRGAEAEAGNRCGVSGWLAVAVNEFVPVRVLIRVRLPLRVGCLRIWMLMSAWHPINLVRPGFAFIAPLA